MRPRLRNAVLLALALASGSAHALGLGQIQVKSGLGQPLLAEIPVVSNDASELIDLEAALASPETFTRIGLEPPIGIVADLHFAVGTDTAGRPIIRVTTNQPVTQPLLNFLIQVDWGEGRLVREYTATVSTPGSIDAQPAVVVEAPTAEEPAVVERPVAVEPAPAPVAAPTPEAPTPAPSTATPAPVTTPAPIAAQPSGAAPAPGEYRVRRGDTASVIASRVTPEGVTSAQTMIGLLRANPEAFIAGDLNQLRSGSVLRVPATPELQGVEAREAADLVRTYTHQVRRARTQPETPVAQAAASRIASAPAETGGRLEIVPPGAGRKARGGTQSGVEAGGEGEMLRQELATTKESLAARDAEVQELKSRVAELEKLQADQQKLIAMQNSQMAAAQQNKAAQAPPPAPVQPAPPSPLPWIGGAVIVALGVLAALWMRRRGRQEPVFRAPSTEPRSSLADAFPPTPAPAAAPVVADEPVDATPSWDRTPATTATRSRRRAPAKAAAPAAATAVELPLEAPSAEGANVERLELAQAYLDMGDTERARGLLTEVAESGDTTTRGVAAKMLRDMG
ncbi:fimbrial protein FimV [Lysobacter sp. TY2-98]|uniref:type IV pilus assembly protein FimV n=1 Tax=Lysobacter sp. TY2-98 TaxID=2290922 RepID=UPI000E205B22|nr:FimV/HubP family polar landmark protein [Lysobacter sp. TY2-98]AXK71928.1 fimbrial protein FimV [Lysobacter sp. TY2-98]